MKSAQQLFAFATERTAARLLDMTPAEFRRLVAEGVLPKPTKLDRWDVEQLMDVMRGDAARSTAGFDL